MSLMAMDFHKVMVGLLLLAFCFAAVEGELKSRLFNVVEVHAGKGGP